MQGSALASRDDNRSAFLADPAPAGTAAVSFIGRRAEVVFVTAFDQYAVEARVPARLRVADEGQRAEFAALLDRGAHELRQRGGVRQHLQRIKPPSATQCA